MIGLTFVTDMFLRRFLAVNDGSMRRGTVALPTNVVDSVKVHLPGNVFSVVKCSETTTVEVLNPSNTDLHISCKPE